LCGFINWPAAGRRRDVWPRPGTSMAQRAHVSDAAAGMRAAHRLRRAQAPAGALAAGRTAPDSVRNHPISVRRHRPPLHRTRSARHGMLRIPRPRRIRQIQETCRMRRGRGMRFRALGASPAGLQVGPGTRRQRTCHPPRALEQGQLARAAAGTLTGRRRDRVCGASVASAERSLIG
jgi:hypothetical protein